MKKARILAIVMAIVLSLGMVVTTQAADEKEELDVTKSVTWDYANPTTSKVTVTSNVPKVENTKVLFLGTLCSAHSLKKETLIESINAIAKNAKVTYHLLNTASEATNGTVAYGSTMTEAQENAFSIINGNNHAALAQFISVLSKELGTDPTVFKYDYIVLEFDSSRLADGATTSDVTDLAKVLEAYYKNNKVIWVTDGFDGITSAKTKTYGTTKYTPTNVYYTGGDGTKNYLTAEQFRMLCSIVAPSYYLNNTTANTEYYGTGQGGTSGTEFTLSDTYSLTPGYKTTTGIYAGHYAEDSRQMYYKDASELSDFLYMAIKGVTLQFNDQIKVSDKDTVSVTKVTLSATTDDVTAVENATNWTTICELDVTSATQETGTDGIKYVQSSSTAYPNGLIKVTAGNTGTNVSKNNLVTVNAIDMKNTIKFVKLVIEMEDSDGFKSCITVKVDEKGNPVLDADGKLQFVMNPNDGAAKVSAYSNGASVSGESIAEGDGVAAAAGVNTRVITSEVTGGTKSQNGGIIKTGEENDNPQSIYSYDGQTVSTTYTPSAGYKLGSITIDGVSVNLDETGAATGTGYTVSTNATTGAITVTFADLSADHSVDVVFNPTVSYEYTGTVPEGAVAVPESSNYSVGATVTADSQNRDIGGYAFSGWSTTDAAVSGGSFAMPDKNVVLKGSFTYAVKVSKTLTSPASGTTVYAGDDLTYAITVTNDSNADVSGYTVIDTLDSNLTFKSGKITDAAGTTVDGTVTEGTGTDKGKVTATITTVPAKSSVTVSITATTNSELTEITKIKNQATGKGSGADDPSLTTGTIETSVDPAPIKVTYSYPGDVKPSVAAPDGETISKGSEYTAKTNVEDTEGYHFLGWYTDEKFKTEYSKTTLSEDTTLYGKWEYAISVEKELTKPAATGTIQGGDEIEYTITVKNDSGADVKDYTVSDTLVSDLTYVKAIASSGTVTPPSAEAETKTVTVTGMTIPKNGSATVTITATVNKELTAAAGTKIANTAVGKDSKEKEVTSDPEEITAYPRTIEVEYKYVGTVTPNGAAVPDSKTDLEYGATYTAQGSSSTTLTNPSWFTFSGWHTDEDLTSDYDSSKALTAENYRTLATTDKVTLYGSWEPVSGYTVTKSVKYDGESIADENIYSNHTVTYYIDVKNNNPESSMTAKVVDVVPEGLDLVEDSISNNGIYAGGLITWELEIPAGETVQVNFNATIPATLDEITDFENKAYVTESNGRTYDGPGDSDEPATVGFTGVPVKVLTFTKDWSDKWDSHEGESVVINIYANGDLLPEQVTLEDDKAVVVYVDAVDEEGVAIEYTYKEVNLEDPNADDVAVGEMNGLYKFTLTETSDKEVATANATIAIVNEYQIRTDDLDFNKVADAKAEAGKPLTYTLTVKNTRAYETATNVVVEDVLPDGLTVDLNACTVAETDDLAKDGENEQKVIWTIGSIAPGATAELKLVVNIPEEATAEEYVNTASITSIGGTDCDDPKESPEAKTTVRNFTVNKIWFGSDGKEASDTSGLPAVNVTLYQNGNKYDDVQLTNANKWTYTWEVLPLCDEDGVPYAYTVAEETVEGYTGAIEYAADAKSEKYGDTAADIKNTLKTVVVKYVFVGDDQPEGATVPNTETLDYGTKYDSAKKPETTEAPFKYYTFDGWFTDSTCKTEYIEETVLNDTSAPDGVMTLYGKWIRKTVKVTIVEPEDGPEVEYEDPWTVNQGEKADPEDMEDPEEEYVFEGYYTDPEFKDKFTDPVLDDDNTENGELKLYPKWTKKISVTYKFTGSIPQGIKVPEGTLLVPGTKYTATKEDGTAENYVFEGWFTDEACTKKFVDNTEITEDIVLYGKWTYVTPNTGDSQNMTLWICLAGLALATCIGAALKTKLKKR